VEWEAGGGPLPLELALGELRTGKDCTSEAPRKKMATAAKQERILSLRAICSKDGVERQRPRILYLSLPRAAAKVLIKAVTYQRYAVMAVLTQ
jgi:hypothetical protein